jgi:hypothetical protein
MRPLLIATCLLLASDSGRAQEPSLKLPAEVKVSAGKFGEVKAETTGRVVKWFPLSPGLDLRPFDGGKSLLFTGQPGRYELLAYTAAGDVPSDPARVAIVIEIPEPLPPPPPKPDTRLKDKLTAALAADKGLKADVVQLAFVYEQAAAAAEDKTIPSTRELLSRVRNVADQLLGGSDALFNLRVAVSEELLAVIGMTSDEPITDAQRKRAAELWRNTTAVLKELAK